MANPQDQIEDLTAECHLLKSLYDRLCVDWDKLEPQLEALAAKWDAECHTCTDGKQAAECAAELRNAFGLKAGGNRVHCYPHKTSWLRGAAYGCLACKFERKFNKLRAAVTALADRWQGSLEPSARAHANDLRALIEGTTGDPS